MRRRIRPLLGASFVVVLAMALAAPAAVLADTPPFLSASFTPTTIQQGSTSTLRFSMTADEVNSATLTGIAFTATLPSGLSLANGSFGGCGGTVTLSGGDTVSLAGGSLAPVMQCHFDVTVAGNAAGSYTVTTSAVSSSAGTGGGGTADLTVNATPAPPTLVQAFGTTMLAQGASTSLTFTVTNPNSSASLSGIGFTDDLPGGLVVADPNGLANTCGGSASAPAASGSISLSGVSLAGGASCTLALLIVGAAPGIQTNTTGVISATESGPGLTSSASVTVATPGTLAMAFNPNVIEPNGTSNLTFGLFNPETAEGTLTGISFTDTLPAGLSATDGTTTDDCSGGTISVTGNTIAFTGGALPPGYLCSFSVAVTAPNEGTYVNTTSALSYDNGVPGGSATATLVVGYDATPPPSGTAPREGGDETTSGAWLIALALLAAAAGTMVVFRRRSEVRR